MPIKAITLQRKGSTYSDEAQEQNHAQGVRGKKITEREQRINVSISKIRYRVGRTFGSMHRWFRAGVARYVGLAKTHAQHIMEAVAYNLYRTPGIIVSNSLK